MANVAAIRQRIVTFSLVSRGFGGANDPIAALLPFLIPIATDLDGQSFDVAVFRSEMRKRYGISLSRDVTEVFVQRLIDFSLLRRIKTTEDVVWVRNRESLESNGNSAHLLEAVISAAKKLHAEKADLLRLPFSEDKFLDALMGVLLNQNVALQSAVSTIGSISMVESKSHPVVAAAAVSRRATDPEEYFASEFITWTAEHRKDLFAWLADLSGTALVAEALIEIRTPQRNQLLRPDVIVYLDSPFLMELLGCSGQAARDDAKLIVDALQSQRITVAVMSHSIDELCGNIRGVLKTPISSRSGPTAKALLFREVTEAYLNTVLNDPEHFTDQLNIQLVDPDKLKHLGSVPTSALENQGWL